MKPYTKSAAGAGSFAGPSMIVAVAISGCAASAAIPTGSAPSVVAVNQVGYAPGSDKVLVLVDANPTPRRWRLIDDGAGRVVAEGRSEVFGFDASSGDRLHKIDVSSVVAPGHYRLQVLGVETKLRIVAKPYATLPEDAVAYFYFHRLGVPLESAYLSNPAHARPALHANAARVKARGGWTDHLFDGRSAWADAGDFGIYLVNHAITAWTLANLHERYRAFGDGTLSIPERGNGMPDVLDEVLFGSTFMERALPPRGLATHKIHNERWSPFPVDLDGEDDIPRWAMAPSTNATWAIARTYAQLARLVRPYDSKRADALLRVAEEAYRRAEGQPDVDYTSKDDGGGSYPDVENDDDAYAAAVELYLSTGAPRYRTAVIDSRHYKAVSPLDWRDVATAGTLSLLSRPNDLPDSDLGDMRQQVVRRATTYAQRIREHGYPTPLTAEQYVWGSNGVVMNSLIIMAYAYDFTRDVQFLKALFRGMDYILGVNAVRVSFVTGYGDHRESDLHDRWAWGAYLAGAPFPSGWLAGGPNNHVINDKATPTGVPPAKSYAGPNTAPKAWCSKENAINWNAALAWVAWYLRTHQSELDLPSAGASR